MKHLPWTICLTLISSVVTSICFVTAWRSNKHDRYRLETAQLLVEAGHTTDAANLLPADDCLIGKNQGSASAWLAVKIDTLIQHGNVAQLRSIFYQHPTAIEKHEPASLLVVRALFLSGDHKAATALREKWLDKETDLAAWMVLDVDWLLSTGKREKALKLLETSKLPDKSDACRLMRLALLNAKQPDKAWKYLHQAYLLDPLNTDVHSFRAQILEAAGKLPEARVEYVAVVVAQPNFALYRNQLAEFYRRHGNLSLALKTWEDAVTIASTDYIELKLEFWSRVIRPHSIDWSGQTLSAGKLQPLVSQLISLPTGRFWPDAQKTVDVPLTAAITSREEARWLRLLQTILDGDELSALSQLESWNSSNYTLAPQLKHALRLVLTYRNDRTVTGPYSEIDDAHRQTEHQFFKRLEALAKSTPIGQQAEPSGDLQKILLDENVFAALFLAEEWPEAALRFYHTNKHTPSWLAYGIAQSLRMNRGTKNAIAFLQTVQATDELTLLLGELLLCQGATQRGQAALQLVANQKNAIGCRASWLLCLAHLDQGQFKSTEQVISNNTLFQKSIPGKELLARLHVLRGKPLLAEQAYIAIEEQSLEAKSYLAQRAFTKHEYEEAQQRTIELIQILPDALPLRANLLMIQKKRNENGQ